MVTTQQALATHFSDLHDPLAADSEFVYNYLILCSIYTKSDQALNKNDLHHMTSLGINTDFECCTNFFLVVQVLIKLKEKKTFNIHHLLRVSTKRVSISVKTIVLARSFKKVLLKV